METVYKFHAFRTLQKGILNVIEKHLVYSIFLFGTNYSTQCSRRPFRHPSLAAHDPMQGEDSILVIQRRIAIAARLVNFYPAYDPPHQSKSLPIYIYIYIYIYITY